MSPSHFFGLTLHGDHLYWTDAESLSIQAAHKTLGDNVTTVIKDLKDVRGIQVFSRNSPQGLMFAS
jgi:hypothetical protein